MKRSGWDGMEWNGGKRNGLHYGLVPAYRSEKMATTHLTWSLFFFFLAVASTPVAKKNQRKGCKA